MSANLIDGKKIAKEVRAEIAEEVAMLNEKGIQPHLTVILIGDDPASHSYVNGKEKASKEVGIISEIIRHPETISEKDLLDEIETLNQNSDVHGILVQLPLPKHIDEQKVIQTISPFKDRRVA